MKICLKIYNQNKKMIGPNLLIKKKQSKKRLKSQRQNFKKKKNYLLKNMKLY